MAKAPANDPNTMLVIVKTGWNGYCLRSRRKASSPTTTKPRKAAAARRLPVSS